MNEALYVYTWEGVLKDYETGYISVVARNIDEARQGALDYLQGFRYSALGPNTNDRHVIEHTQPDIEEFTVPYVFAEQGSG